MQRPPVSKPLPLSWSRTVAREMVHRVSVAEVLLTDVRPGGPARFEAAAQWPRSHPTFPRGGDGRHNPVMVVETLRQLGIYIPLRYYGVSPMARFLIKDVSFTIDPSREPRAGHGATEVTCLTKVTGIRTDARREAVTGLRLTARFLVDGRIFAHAEGGARFVDDWQYAAVRGPHVPQPARPVARSSAPPPRPQPHTVAVASPLDVMLAWERGTLLLEPADLRHPFFFDHGTDHVPGMALLEAARQAAAVRSGGRLLRSVACRLKALRFTEFSPPARIECVTHGKTCVFRFRQDGRQTAVGVLQYP